MVAHPQFRQVRKLLDAYDGVVEGRLERLGHGVGQDHSDHHRQDVGDLPRQFKDDDRRGHGVGDGPGQRRSTWAAVRNNLGAVGCLLTFSNQNAFLRWEG